MAAGDRGISLDRQGSRENDDLGVLNDIAVPDANAIDREPEGRQGAYREAGKSVGASLRAGGASNLAAINFSGRSGVIPGIGGSGGANPSERMNNMEISGGPLSQVGNQVAQSYGTGAAANGLRRENLHGGAHLSNVSNSALVHSGNAAILGHGNLNPAAYQEMMSGSQRSGNAALQ